MGERHLKPAPGKILNRAEETPCDHNGASLLQMEIRISDFTSFRQRNLGSGGEIKDTGVVNRGKRLLHFRQERIGFRRERTRRSPQCCHEEISSRRKAIRTILPAVIRADARNWNQLPLAGGEAEPQHLDAGALERFAVSSNTR